MCAQTLKLLLSALSTAGSADQLLAPLAKQTLQVLVDNVKYVAPLLLSSSLSPILLHSEKPYP
jgi:hypothetical protein